MSTFSRKRVRTPMNSKKTRRWKGQRETTPEPCRENISNHDPQLFSPHKHHVNEMPEV